MQLSAQGRDHLRRAEGVVRYVYDDARGAGYKPTSWSDFRGYPTIALGRKIEPNEFGQFTAYLNGNPVSEELLQQLIHDTISVRETKLSSLLQDVPVTQEMYDALFSFMYNVGQGASKFKAAIAALAQKDDKGKWEPDYMAAVQAIATGPMTSKGVQLPVLVKRRAEEAAMFMSGGLPTGANAGKLMRPLLFAGVGVVGSVLVILTLRRKRRLQITRNR